MTTAVSLPAREQHRRELAELLGHDPAALTDTARLAEDLALDSLAMMRVLVWLEQNGVTVDTDRRRPAHIGDVLSLLDATSAGRISVRVVDGQDIGSPTATVPFLPSGAARSLAPVLETPAIQLTPIAADDINFLYALAVDPQTGFRWRYRGVAPSVDRFVSELWTDVLVQYVARSADEDRPVGHVVAYGADPNRRHCYIAAAFQPGHTGTGAAAQTVAVFARYLFHTFPMHKLYFDIPGYNWPQIGSGEGRLFTVEGLLRDHDFYAGRTWDRHICAIYRDLPAM